MDQFETFAVGHDFGNTDTCSMVVGNGLRTERRIPSVYSSGSWKKVETTAKGSGKEVADILKSDHYVLEYDVETSEGLRRVGKNFGQKVFDDGDKPLSTRGDSSRYWINNYNIESLMVATATQIPLSEYGVYVVTGMPIATYLDDAENANRVAQALERSWTFILNGERRTMHVLKARPIMEGAGALIAYGGTDDSLQGVVDIGGHTTDLFVAKGQKPQASRCTGFSGGVAAAADRLNVKFREAYGYSLSMEGLQELLRQHVQGLPYRTVMDKQRNRIPTPELVQMIETSLREIGQDIATNVAAQWDDIQMEMQQILVVGGGAHYFSKDLQARFAVGRTTTKPEMANVAGYTKLAEGMMYRARVQTSQQMRTA